MKITVSEIWRVLQEIRISTFEQTSLNHQLAKLCVYEQETEEELYVSLLLHIRRTSLSMDYISCSLRRNSFEPVILTCCWEVDDENKKEEEQKTFETARDWHDEKLFNQTELKVESNSFKDSTVTGRNCLFVSWVTCLPSFPGFCFVTCWRKKSRPKTSLVWRARDDPLYISLLHMVLSSDQNTDSAKCPCFKYFQDVLSSNQDIELPYFKRVNSCQIFVRWRIGEGLFERWPTKGIECFTQDP